MSQSTSGVTVAPTSTGCVIAVLGRGTVRESRAIIDFVTRTFQSAPETRVTIDLSGCGYVDSTFLGTLIDLHRLAVAAGPDRLFVAGSMEHRKKLLGIARLEKLIPGIEAAPPTAGPSVPLVAPDAAPTDFLRHISKCHQKLAEIDCPMQQVFARIATQMERELDRSS